MAMQPASALVSRRPHSSAPSVSLGHPDIALTLGRDAGVVRFRGITVPSLWFGAWVKGRTVFVPRYRARVGLS